MPRATVEKLWQEWADNAPPNPADDVVVHPAFEAKRRERVEEIERQFANVRPRKADDVRVFIAVALNALTSDADWRNHTPAARATHILQAALDGNCSPFNS